ncbi:nucleoside diphosphate kinase 2, partial [Tanacetum coccineum]
MQQGKQRLGILNIHAARQAAVGNFEEDENKQKFGCCVRTNNRNRDRSAGCIIMFLGILLTAWAGIGVVASAHKLIGETSPLQAEPETIREDLAIQTGRNVVHGSDSPKERAI